MQSCLYCIDKTKPINDICYEYSKSINRKYHTLIDLWFNKCTLGENCHVKNVQYFSFMFCSFNNQQKKKPNYIHVLVNQQFNKLPSFLQLFTTSIQYGPRGCIFNPFQLGVFRITCVHNDRSSPRQSRTELML